MDSQDFVTNLTDRKVWFRILYMLLYGLIFYLIETAVLVIAVFQIIYRIFMNEPHEQLRTLSKDLVVYVKQVVEYLMFTSDYQPFPVGEWPGSSRTGHRSEPSAHHREPSAEPSAYKKREPSAHREPSAQKAPEPSAGREPSARQAPEPEAKPKPEDKPSA